MRKKKRNIFNAERENKVVLHCVDQEGAVKTTRHHGQKNAKVLWESAVLGRNSGVNGRK